MGTVHPELIEEYDPSNEIDIFKAFPNGKESVKWVCKDCDHTWEATFALRHMGSGKCPECYKVGRNIKEECLQLYIQSMLNYGVLIMNGLLMIPFTHQIFG